MQFMISKSSMERALQVVSKVVPTNAQVPVLSGVMVVAGDGTVELSGTDTTSSMRCRVQAQVYEGGSTVLPCKLLLGAVKSLPDMAVTFELDGTLCKVSCGRSRMALHVLDPSDFPSFPTVEPERSVTLPAEDVAAMVERTHRFVSKDNSKPVLAGICLTVSGDLLRMVATDHYRLAVCEMRTESSEDFEAIVPGVAMHQVMQSMSGEVTIGESENQLVVSSGGTTYVTRRMVGNYPNYRLILPESHKVEAVVDSDEVAQALKRVGVVASDNPSVRVGVGDGELDMYASSPKSGESRETIGCETSGSMVIALNYHYLLEAMDAMDGEVTMELSDPIKPLVMRCHGRFESLHLLMPVRM